MNLQIATFAGGCFWCMQPPYDALPGVLKTTVGFTGGHTTNPSYREVCAGGTGHAEAVQIEFDADVIHYKKLLEVFWQNIDPTTRNRQFADAGEHYRTAIFYHSEEQKTLAEKSKQTLAESKKFRRPIVTEITLASEFYLAEAYHQCYYQSNAEHYNRYKVGSGRADFIRENWEK